MTTVQGLKGHTGEEVRSSRCAPVTACPHHEGHILRWVKQTALRGHAREEDHDGICGIQKLVVTGDPERLLENLQAAFPGASFSMEPSATERRHSKLMKLAELLLTPDLPVRVSTTEIGRLLGVEWRRIVEVNRSNRQCQCQIDTDARCLAPRP